MKSSSGGTAHMSKNGLLDFSGVLGEIKLQNEEENRKPRTDLCPLQHVQGHGSGESVSNPGSPKHHGYMPSKFRKESRPWAQGHWIEGQDGVKDNSLHSSVGLSQFRADMAVAMELDKNQHGCHGYDRDGVGFSQKTTYGSSGHVNHADKKEISERKSSKHTPESGLDLNLISSSDSVVLEKMAKKVKRRSSSACNHGDSSRVPQSELNKSTENSLRSGEDDSKMENKTDTQDPAKYLRNSSPQKISRRSMSDLGFRNAKPFTSKSRTLSLLQHPAFRNRIARSMSLDPNENDFEKSVCEKLSAKVEESFCLPPDENVDTSQRRGSGQSLRLCCSTSDLGFLKDLQSQISKEPHSSVDGNFVACRRSSVGHVSDIPSNTENKDPADRVFSPHAHSSIDKRARLVSTVANSSQSPLASEQRSVQSVSAFKIPSFEEFKTRSKHGRLVRSSTVGEYMAPKVETILEEEHHGIPKHLNEPINKHSSNDTINKTAPRDDSSPLYHESSSRYQEHRIQNVQSSSCEQLCDTTQADSSRDDLSILSTHRRKKKKKVRPSRNTDLGIVDSIHRTQSLEGGLDDQNRTRKHEKSKFKVPFLQPSELLSKFSKHSHANSDRKPRPKRVKSNSECSHESVDSILSSHNFNEVPKKSRTAKVKEKFKKLPLFRSHSEAQLNKVGGETVMKRTESANTVLSDYASDSNGELSDSLEDVFLKPASSSHHHDHRSDNANKERSAKGHLKGQRSDLARSVHFTDSGCLVDRSSPDLTMISGRPDDETTMWRSVSDISDMFAEEQRQKWTRERKNKGYKSDPFNASGDKPVQQNHIPQGMTRKDSTEDILNFLDGIKSTDEGLKSSGSGSHGNTPVRSRRRQRRLATKPPTGRKKVSSSAEVERVDSGVGRETRSPEAKKKVTSCEDCQEKLLDLSSPGGSTVAMRSSDPHSPGGSTVPMNTSDLNSPGSSTSLTEEPGSQLVCNSCSQKRTQRKEAILEMIETEQNYGNDLKILEEQFYEPMKTMGLLTTDQIQTIFNNLQELLSVNKIFASRLQNDLDLAAEHQDESLQTFYIGQSFLDSSNMLLAYETYCINQSAGPVLLDQLIDEKELLRIFLEVTQRERAVLRKMDLKAFLMVPVQRIMKYPLLLSRIYKVTPLGHPDRVRVQQAQKKIENILELINYKTKSSANVRLRRRASLLRRSGEFDVAFENIETHKAAMEILGWDRSNIHFLCVGRLFCVPPPDHLWAKKGKTLKFTSVYGLLATNGKYPADEAKQKPMMVSRPCPVKDAALVIVKEKAGKYQAFREPFPLKDCVVAVDPDFDEVFEVHEAMKESLLFKGEHQSDTDQWLRQVRMVVRDMSQWRHRRHGLANIMLQNT